MSDTAVHLGHTITSNDRDNITKSAKSSFWKSFNILIAEFGKLSPFVISKLFNQYCCSFYGSPLWSISGAAVQALCVDWRKALRSMWRLNPQTHCDLITALSSQIPLIVSLKGTDHVGTFMGLKCVVYYANYRSGHQSSKIQVVP